MGYNLHITLQGECWMAMTTRKGPNDADTSFGPQGSFFLMLTNVLQVLITKYMAERTAMMKTGLDDMSGVVQALGEFLCFFLVFFNTN